MHVLFPGNRNPPATALDRELHRAWLLGWGILAAGCVILGLAWHWRAAGQWLVQAGGLWAVVFHQLARRTDLNRPAPGADPYPDLGPGTRLTLLRGGLIALTGGFMFRGWPPGMIAWAPGILYGLAAIIDRVDGYAARRSGHTSELGTELDTLFDALGLAVAPLLAAWYGQVHWTYLSVGGAYYLFRWGIHRRRKHGLPVHELAPNLLRRTLAGFQMGFIAVTLLPVLPAEMTRIAGAAFMLPLLAGFTVDWLAVSGRINRASARYLQNLHSFSAAVFQPALRLVTAITVLPVARQTGAALMPPAAGSWHDMVMAWGFLLGAALVLLGIGGRIAALGILVLLGWHYSISPAVGSAGMILIFTLIWLLLLGSGRYSLWRWDDAWVNRYDGA